MSTTAETTSIDELRELLSGAGDLPVLPELASQVLQELRSPRVTTASLAALVKKDPVLASSVLRVANSALYGARVEITDLAFAMTRVGLNQTRNLVLANVLRSRLADSRVYGPQGPVLMDHALAVAFASQLLADSVDQDREEAFLCGLLHDFGRLALIKALRESHQITSEELPQDLTDTADRYHCEAGALLANSWGLPAIVGTVARYHHEIEEAPEEDRLMVAMISLANALAHKLGLGQDEKEDIELEAHAAFQHLAIEPQRIDELTEKLPGVFQTARASMGCGS